jgi:hypothetical protein
MEPAYNPTIITNLKKFFLDQLSGKIGDPDLHDYTAELMTNDQTYRRHQRYMRDRSVLRSLDGIFYYEDTFLRFDGLRRYGDYLL